ncbi:TPA: glycosyltransferase [Streptococcus agalactiae]
MTDKLVSVIIPVYNAAPYLEGCVNTILGQTYQVFEILLIDDGSTDTSASICDQLSLRDNRIRVFHIENGGASKARNFGLARISPESQFVTFVDSDDWVKENYLEVLLAQQEKYNADIVISNYYIYRETEDIFGYYITDKDFVIEEISAQTAIDRQYALTVTLTDDIWELEHLLQRCPNTDFHIAAPVYCSDRLKQLVGYPNYYLHEAITEEQFEVLLLNSDIYLDINHGEEVWNVVDRCITEGKTIYGIRRARKDNQYISFERTMDDFEYLCDTIKQNR